MSTSAASRGGRVILIGAGATRGASLGFQAECAPPLNQDFFTQLQRITIKHTDLVRSVIEDVADLFGYDQALTLEDYFTQLEFLTATAENLDASHGSSTGLQYRNKRDRLMAALSAVLEVSTSLAIAGRNSRGCDLHRTIARALLPGDTVISFNYDCVMDHALRAECPGRWESAVGYSFPRTVKVVGADFWSPGVPLNVSRESVRLLKLHGSLNWQLPRDTKSPVKLKQRLHQQRGTPRFDIVPPEWNKSIRGNVILAHLWQEAFEAVRAADRIAVVGFSFAPTDLHAESLFRLGLDNHAVTALVIANPSERDRTRVKRVFGAALRRGGGIVREYETLSEMAGAWPGCIDR